MRRWGWWLWAGIGLLSAPATAQTAVVNPTTVQFAASADHATLVEGQPLVASYEVRYRVVGTASVVCQVNLGKPTPMSGTVSMPLPSTCVPLSPTTRYEAIVAALGPTGAGVSAPSNPFVVVGPPAAPASVAVSRP